MKTLAIGTIAFLAFTPASAAIYTVTETTDSGDGVCDTTCTFRDAILAADVTAEDDIINFGFTGTIELVESIPSEFGRITGGGKLTIEGPGAPHLTIVAGGIFSGIRIGFGAEVEISHLTITEGFAAEGFSDGGAISNLGTLTLNYVTVSNSWADFAGGIYNAGTLTLNNSTVTNCFGTFLGGGIESNGSLTLNNTTVSGNSTLGGGGGIISGGILMLSNSTVTNNVNVGGSTSGASDGGGIYHFGPTATLSNSIVAGNFDLDDFAGEVYPDVVGSFNSLGYNLIGTTDGSTGFTAAGDQTGTVAAPLDPLLGPLQDNGGPTHTHALLAGSPAIDAGSNSLIPAGTAGDQRGFLRIVNGTVDIGAFEFGDGQTLIDIKPGNTPNSINPTSGQMIPVAILTTDTFDATQVDWATIAFGPNGATESHWRAHVKDVDDDGDMDLLLHFAVRDTGIACGDVEAALSGETFSGETIAGTDSIVTVKCD